MLYDLLISGGRVISPAQGLDRVCDIAVSGGRIERLEESIAAGAARNVLDASGRIVTPGLIDFHCHVYDAIGIAVQPDQAGILQGVTAVVDGGSAGQCHFADFAGAHAVRPCTQVYYFLNISSSGLSVIPEFRGWDEVELDACRETIVRHRDVIKGLKLRLVGDLIAAHGREVLEAAKGIARESGLPLMVHIGDAEKKVPAELTAVCLNMLERGDVLLHIYTPQQGGLPGEDGSLMPGLREAMKRGVLLDAAPGVYNLSYEVTRALMAQGIVPDIISSDVTSWSLAGPVYGLPVTMSRYMGLGLSLEQVIAMTTAAPARVLGLEGSIGGLEPGMAADISVLELRSGRWSIPDTLGEELALDTLLTPVCCLKGGEVIPSHPVAWP